MQIYFRIHVSVLKLLFSKYPDVDVSVLEEHLQRALQGPFHHPEFDSDTGPGTVYRTESTTSGLLSLPYIHLRSGWKNITVLSSLRRVERERGRERVLIIFPLLLLCRLFRLHFLHVYFFELPGRRRRFVVVFPSIVCSQTLYFLFRNRRARVQK